MNILLNTFFATLQLNRIAVQHFFQSTPLYQHILYTAEPLLKDPPKKGQCINHFYTLKTQHFLLY